MSTEAIDIKKTVKAVIAKMEKRKALAAELAKLDAELKEYGITVGKERNAKGGKQMSKDEKIEKIKAILADGKEHTTTEIKEATGIDQASGILGKEMRHHVTRGGKGGKQGYTWKLKH